LQEANN